MHHFYTTDALVTLGCFGSEFQQDDGILVPATSSSQHSCAEQDAICGSGFLMVDGSELSFYRCITLLSWLSAVLCE